MQIDQTDLAILGLLRGDGRMSNREVGRALGISEGTVRQRLRKLIDGKAMRLGVVTDLHSSGLAVNVTLHIRVLPARVRAVAAAIAEIEACTFVGLTFGRYDILAALVARTRIEAAEIIDNRIAGIDGIQAIDVREPVSYAKHRYDLVHIVDADPAPAEPSGPAPSKAGPSTSASLSLTDCSAAPSQHWLEADDSAQ